MLTTYIVISVILLIACLVMFVLSLADWAYSKKRVYSYSDPKKDAQTALAFLVGIVLSWAWPIIVPLLFAYLAYRLIQDATAPDNTN